jgi:uncharacterized protein (TIGR02246 family)
MRIDPFIIKRVYGGVNWFKQRKGNLMDKRLCVVFFAVLTIIFSTLAFGQESVDTAIRNRVKQFEAAYNSGNADSTAAIYAVDATHTFANGLTYRGRVEIANGLKEQFAGPMKGTQIALTPLHIRALSPDIAVEEASFSLSGLKDSNGAVLPPIGGFCLVVYQKIGEQWFVAAAQCMVPPPGSQPK